MTERDPPNSAPASSASASTLRAPSPEAAELEARAADARAQAEASEHSKADEERARREKAAAAAQAERASEARAPTGFVRSMRFFYLGGLGVVGLAVFFGMLTEVDGPMPWPVVAGVVSGYAAVLTGFALDNALWRRRLPFPINGFDVIEGKSRADSDEAPIVGFTIRIEVAGDTKARDQTLEILAGRVNAILKKDSDLKDSSGKYEWRVNDGTLTGSCSFQIYTTRVIERWLRSDVRLLAKVTRIERVYVNARYTGDTFSLPSS
jgi:hypothetical protein